MSNINKRVYAGHYRRYDGQMFWVVNVGKDYATNEDEVIFCKASYSQNRTYFTMPRTEFNKTVEFKGETVPMFVRRDMKMTRGLWELVQEDGFYAVHRVHKKHKEEEPRQYRDSTNYYDYAKDLCKNYVADNNKRKVCKENNKFIQMTKWDYINVSEDCYFLRLCFKTSLAEYRDYFKERYIEGFSIRGYGYKHNMNRGSVEHIERKMINALAAELKLRDEVDGKRRIKNEIIEDDEIYEEDESSEEIEYEYVYED